MRKRVSFDSSQLEESLLAAGEDILDASEKLNTLLEMKVSSENIASEDEVLEEDYQKMVYSTSTTVRLSDEWCELDPDDILIGLLSPIAKKVRKSVLNFVPTTKAAFSNSLDYLTKNTQIQSFFRVDKYTRGLCAIIEIIHRNRLRCSGLTFGSIDQMDAECILFVKVANNLTSESRHIITLALQGDPLEILTCSETFLRAIEDLIDITAQYKIPNTEAQQKLLRGQHQAIIILSQDAKRFIEKSSQLSRDDLDESGANISEQIISCTIELILAVIFHYQKQWQELIDKETAEHNPEAISNTSVGPRRPQKPQRTASGRVSRGTITRDSSTGRSHTRSVRLDYERKYGMKPSFLNEAEDKQIKKKEKAYVSSVPIKREPSPVLGSKPRRSRTGQRDFSPKEPEQATKKRSSEPAVKRKGYSGSHIVLSQPKELRNKQKKNKRKRLSFSIRSRSNSASEPKRLPSGVLPVQYVDAPDEAEEKLNMLFQDPAFFMASPENQNDPDLMAYSGSINIRRPGITKRKSKKRKSQGKSMPDAKFLRSAPCKSDIAGVPVFRTTTTFIPKMERSGSSAEYDLSEIIRKHQSPTLKDEERSGSQKKEKPECPRKKVATAKNENQPIPQKKEEPIVLNYVQEEDEEEEEKRKQFAMAAAMASSVPIVIDLFNKEFHWFSKEWGRMSMSDKNKFTTKLRNELVKVNDISAPKPVAKVAQEKLHRQGSFTPLNSVRSQIKEKQDQDELEGMMVPLSSKVRWFHRSTSLSNVLTKEDAESLQQSEQRMEKNVHQVVCVIEDFIDAQASIRDKPPQTLSANVVDVYNVLTSIVKLSTNSADNKIVRQMAVPTIELKEIGSYTQVHVTLLNLRMNVYDKLKNLSALTAQLRYTIQCVDLSVKKISHADTLQLIACTRAIVDTIKTLLDIVATYSHIRVTLSEAKCNQIEKSHSQSESEENIWEYKASSEETLDCCSMNYFITEITNPFNNTPERVEYEKAFILCFQSLISSVRLYGKLIERFHVPEHISASKEEIFAVQKRVAELLLHWVKEQYDHISKDVIRRMLSFCNQISKSGHETLANDISNLIQLKNKEESNFHNLSFKCTPLTLVKSATETNLYELFLAASERTIAEQLTVMDFKIFKRIHHRELIDQSWNKNRHCSVNVIDHITRLNHVSYWVPSLILWSEKLKQRGEVLWKFVRIGQELLKLHNYNTLMGLVAGLNMSCITRLKYTLSVLPDHQRAALENLGELFNPVRSFKIYREHIEKAERPVIPYLGVYLTDLTFIDDGNTNVKGSYINFAKEILVASVLEKIRYFQEVDYELEDDHVLGVYLKELASLDDEGLYQLSLTREPRNAEMFDIL